MITVFTPTYNRAYCLGNLYESLLCQTKKDFEWLVVDDGSTDNTKELIERWKMTGKLNIHYERIKNGGKANAINFGVQRAEGELFFIVDSDDILMNSALEKIEALEKTISTKTGFAGLCFRRGNFSGELLGKKLEVNVCEATSLEIAYKYGLVCDKAEVFYTEVLKNYPFPEIKGCKFCPEALIFNRIARDGLKLKIQDDVIYLCEYMNDGYTKNFMRNLKNNAAGFAPYYKELFFTKGVPLIVHAKAFARYLQCICFMKKRRKIK